MGRGRAKAKQTKVARQLKYSSGGTDLSRLANELGASTFEPAAERRAVRGRRRGRRPVRTVRGSLQRRRRGRGRRVRSVVATSRRLTSRTLASAVRLLHTRSGLRAVLAPVRGSVRPRSRTVRFVLSARRGVAPAARRGLSSRSRRSAPRPSVWSPRSVISPATQASTPRSARVVSAASTDSCRDDRDHADAHVQGLLQLQPLDLAGPADQVEDRGRGPGRAVDRWRAGRPGSTRARLVASPPPVMWLKACTSVVRVSARQSSE